MLYAFILRRSDLSRKNGWVDEYGRIYLYYPINEVVELLHCGRQKTAKANPKIAALQVEIAHVDSEIEKLVDSLTDASRNFWRG